jgi:DNA-directed RNA polymerase specialized sigma24 family protein
VADALDQCLELLPPESRQALRGWYAESWDINRIADSLGTSVTAAYKTLQRLRMRLLDCIRHRLATTREENT